MLDISCGDGYGSALLAAVAVNVTSVDPAAVPLHPMQAHFKCYAEEMAFREEFDLVVSFETIEHSIAPRLFLFKLWEALRPSGLLLISFPNNWGETAFHLHNTTFQTIDLVSEFFLVDAVFAQNRRHQIEPKKISPDSRDRWVENIIVLGERKLLPERPLRPFEEIYREVQRKQLELTRSWAWKLKQLHPRIATAIKRRIGRKE